MSKEERFKELEQQINYYNDRYYKDCVSEISDYDYDMLVKEAETLKKELGVEISEALDVAGSDVKENSGFADYTRTRIMGSVPNCYDIDELRNWLTSLNTADTTYIVEPKYDGLSLSLEYDDGILTRATTRGNGYTGSDVTKNVFAIESIPKALNKFYYDQSPCYLAATMTGLYVPSHVEIRGELLMPKSVFKELNEQRAKDGLQLFANTRNAAAGSLKQLDPEVTRSRRLIFKPYSIYSDDKSFMDRFVKDHDNGLRIAGVYGFAPEWWKCMDVSTTIKVVKEFETLFLHNQDYCMDGCVIKINSVDRQNELGYTQKNPKWAKAFKFKQEEVSTKLIDCVWEVSGQGKLCPVGILEPVELDGSVISAVTLNNIDYIKSHNIVIGGYYFIHKGGGVIPVITDPDYERNLAENIKIDINSYEE